MRPSGLTSWGVEETDSENSQSTIFNPHYKNEAPRNRDKRDTYQYPEAGICLELALNSVSPEEQRRRRIFVGKCSEVGGEGWEG